MGSKLRKLRVQAGVAGERYQQEQRRKAHRREREFRLAQEALGREIAESKGLLASTVPRRIETRPDGSLVASFNSPGGQLAAEPVLVVGPEPRRPPASAMRLSRLQSVVAVSMLLAGLPGKEES